MGLQSLHEVIWARGFQEGCQWKLRHWPQDWEHHPGAGQGAYLMPQSLSGGLVVQELGLAEDQKAGPTPAQRLGLRVRPS
jgi:hypothetical protein